MLTHSGFLSEKENSFPDANAILCYRYSVSKILSFDALLRDAQVRDEFFLTTAYPKPQKLFSHDVFLQTKDLIGAAGALENPQVCHALTLGTMSLHLIRLL